MQRSERSRPGIADKTAEKVFPAAQGYEMPAEWERHEATWLAWPHNPEHWDDLSEVERIYDRMVCVIAESEIVDTVGDQIERLEDVVEA